MTIDETEKIKLNGHNPHSYLFNIPPKLWAIIKSMAKERDLNIRSMMVILLKEGIKSELEKEEGK